jgi:hypothetical protein
MSGFVRFFHDFRLGTPAWKRGETLCLYIWVQEVKVLGCDGGIFSEFFATDENQMHTDGGVWPMAAESFGGGAGRMWDMACVLD